VLDFHLPIYLSHIGVTCFQFCSILKSAIRFAGYNPGQYNTHSVIIGAATTVVMLGKTDDQIKQMGKIFFEICKVYVLPY
jgi:hypothetical protein